MNYGEWIRKYAAEDNLTDVDFNAPMAAMLRKADSTNPPTAQKILPGPRASQSCPDISSWLNNCCMPGTQDR